MSDEPATASPTIEQLRHDLEATRTAYHELAASLSETDWKVKSGNDAWTVGQLMWHLAWGAQFATMGAQGLRGKKQFSPPRPVFNMINPWLTRLGSRGANKASVTRKYDEAHAKVIAALGEVSTEDLDTKVIQLGEEHTVAYHFQMPARHLAEHEADIRQALRRE